MVLSITVAGGKRISQSWILLQTQKTSALAKKQANCFPFQSNEGHRNKPRSMCIASLWGCLENKGHWKKRVALSIALLLN
jgi:hypothetical protein